MQRNGHAGTHVQPQGKADHYMFKGEGNDDLALTYWLQLASYMSNSDV